MYIHVQCTQYMWAVDNVHVATCIPGSLVPRLTRRDEATLQVGWFYSFKFLRASVTPTRQKVWREVYRYVGTSLLMGKLLIQKCFAVSHYLGPVSSHLVNSHFVNFTLSIPI